MRLGRRGRGTARGREGRLAGPVAAGLLAGFAALWGCQAPNEKVPSETWNFERMIQQRSYRAYEPTDLFPDGTVMRPPPEGTVPRERRLGPPELVDGTSGGRPVARVPLQLTMELLAKGRHHFDILCAACHGPAGDGVSPVAEVMALRKPPSLHQARIRDLPDGAIYRVIRDGYGMMPGYGSDLTIEERWAVVAYLRALELSRRAPVAELPAGMRRELERAAAAAGPRRREAGTP